MSCSHTCVSPSRHGSHTPQPQQNGTVTRSPTARPCTSGADLDHLAAELVPGHVGQHDRRVVAHPPVPVRAAHAGREHVARRLRRRRHTGSATVSIESGVSNACITAARMLLTLATFGLDAFREAIAHGIELAEHAEATCAPPVGDHVAASLGVVTFRRGRRQRRHGAPVTASGFAARARRSSTAAPWRGCARSTPARPSAIERSKSEGGPTHGRPSPCLWDRSYSTRLDWSGPSGRSAESLFGGSVRGADRVGRKIVNRQALTTQGLSTGLNASII